MRDFEMERTQRVAFLRRALLDTGLSGFVFGNSGGKDSALVGILCRMASENTVGIAMPCASSVNFGDDMRDAMAVARQYGIQTRTVDLTAARTALVDSLAGVADISPAALSNIAPRLRMTTLYAVAASESRLVVGTDNRSEIHTGYFTKWGDGAYDINPISDLTVTEIYAFLRHLGAPQSILDKAPSAGLFEGQTDETEMGVTYPAIDRYLETGEGAPGDIQTIERLHASSAHKRRPPLQYRAHPVQAPNF